MATLLKLYLDDSEIPHVIWFRRPDGSLNSLPAVRLIAHANFLRCLAPAPTANTYAITKAVIDTGAYFTIVAERLWWHFIPGYVTPLPFDSRTPAHLRTVTIAGGTFPYELGELTIRLEDRDRNVLPVTVIAKITRDGGRLPIPLTIGLRGGFFENRKLLAEPNATAMFGQLWTLTDP